MNSMESCRDISDLKRSLKFQMFDTINSQTEYEQLTRTQLRKSSLFMSNYVSSLGSSAGSLSTSCLSTEDISSSFSQSQVISKIYQQFSSFSGYSSALLTLKMVKSNDLVQSLIMLPFKKIIGQGSGGVVSLRFLVTTPDSIFGGGNLIPVAAKKVESADEFAREWMVLNSIQAQSKPVTILCQPENQVIIMELCVCSLEEMKKYLAVRCSIIQDEFYAIIILQLIQRAAIDLIESNKIFHGDIKPSNLAIALRYGQLQIIFIDFGAASFYPEDYFSSYTPAYCFKPLFQAAGSGLNLTFDEIRFAELFSCCRTLQYLMMIPNQQAMREFNKNESNEPFLKMCEQSFPVTSSILKRFLGDRQSTSITYYEVTKILKLHAKILEQPLIPDKEDFYFVMSQIKNIQQNYR